MASVIRTLSLTLLFSLLLSAHTAFSANSTEESSPSPTPELPPDYISPSPATPPSSSAPSPSPALSVSPPAPPPSDLAHNSPSPAPSTGEDDETPSPAPSPDMVENVSRAGQSNVGNFEAKEDSSGGMSGGKKAGVAIGVIAAGCVVGVLALVYKKRQQNIRRSQYGYAARRDNL